MLPHRSFGDFGGQPGRVGNCPPGLPHPVGLSSAEMCGLEERSPWEQILEAQVFQGDLAGRGTTPGFWKIGLKMTFVPFRGTGTIPPLLHTQQMAVEMPPMRTGGCLLRSSSLLRSAEDADHGGHRAGSLGPRGASVSQPWSG